MPRAGTPDSGVVVHGHWGIEGLFGPKRSVGARSVQLHPGKLNLKTICARFHVGLCVSISYLPLPQVMTWLLNPTLRPTKASHFLLGHAAESAAKHPWERPTEIPPVSPPVPAMVGSAGEIPLPPLLELCKSWSLTPRELVHGVDEVHKNWCMPFPRIKSDAYVRIVYNIIYHNIS